MRVVTSILDFIDNRAVIRRIVLLTTVGMTVWVTRNAWAFALQSQFDGVGTAAVIAAVTAPLAALQGFAFSIYSQNRASKQKGTS